MERELLEAGRPVGILVWTRHGKGLWEGAERRYVGDPSELWNLLEVGTLGEYSGGSKVSYLEGEASRSVHNEK